LIKYTCLACEKKIVIDLFPDFSSSALWCSNPGCGCEISDPVKSLSKLPKRTLALIEMWNGFWDMQMTNSQYNHEYFKILFDDVGSYLAQEINKEYECKFERNNESNFVYLHD
jgi:hypothetical protein